ncbi:MAG: SCO family protein [Calditrichaceae bacterium]
MLSGIDTRLILMIILFLVIIANGQVNRQKVSELQNIDVSEYLGETIPLNLKFTDDHGNRRDLNEFFHQGKPVVMILAYYNCPMLCTLVLNGVSQTVSEMDWIPGKQYELLTVSIDPKETAELAAAKKKTHLDFIQKDEAQNGWTFFVGEQPQIDSLANALGFEYYYVEERDEFAHPAVVFVLTPEGEISRYLYGIEYRASDLRLALLEASEGRIGSTIDRLILYCYHYDPSSKGYVIFAGNVMRLGGAITLLIMIFVLGIYWLNEYRRKSIV